MDVVRNPVPITAVPVIPSTPGSQMPNLPVISMDPLDVGSLPEMERFTVELKKDIYGLGITIAGYVCEKGKGSRLYIHHTFPTLHSFFFLNSLVSIILISCFFFFSVPYCRGIIRYFCEKYKRRKRS